MNLSFLNIETNRLKRTNLTNIFDEILTLRERFYNTLQHYRRKLDNMNFWDQFNSDIDSFVFVFQKK